jgi:hypothetical protein
MIVKQTFRGQQVGVLAAPFKDRCENSSLLQDPNPEEVPENKSSHGQRRSQAGRNETKLRAASCRENKKTENKKIIS